MPDHPPQDGDVLDLFAGARGWDVGARDLGLDPLGIELDKDACATSEAAGFRTLRADIAALDPMDFAPVVGVIASAPCPSFSRAGKRLGLQDLPLIYDCVQRMLDGEDPRLQAWHDERSALTLEPLRWVLALEPEWCAFEQVPDVLPVWEHFALALQRVGYKTWTGCLRAEQYGVPQTRERAFLLASRTRQPHAPEPTHQRFDPKHPPSESLCGGLRPWVSMGEALGLDTGNGLAIRSNYGTGGDPAARGVRTADQPAASVTGKVGRNYWMHAAGATSVPGRPRRLDQPAATITGKGTAAWGDGTGNGATIRRVTVEEAAVFQSFRRDYPWRGDSTSQYQQVGNAVPPVLARAIVAAVAV